jgi:hypothetical protein
MNPSKQDREKTGGPISRANAGSRPQQVVLECCFMKVGDPDPCLSARRRLWHVALGFCLFAGLLCSCSTPYKPLERRYGYSGQQVSNGVYEVSFHANGHSSYQRALDFAMLRASEIALSHHARSFAVLDVINLSSARKYLRPSYPYQTTALYMSPADETILPPAGPISWTFPSYQVIDFPETRIYYRPGVKLIIKLLPIPLREDP